MTDEIEAQKQKYPFLRVDDFLASALAAQALKVAFQLGLIDTLATLPALSQEQARRYFSQQANSGSFLLETLRANRVLEVDEPIRLTPSFREVLPYRDLLITKIKYAEICGVDILLHASDLFTEFDNFIAKAAIYRIFDYPSCMVVNAENVQKARFWMSLTTGLTKYEALPLLDVFDFSGVNTMLDIGGNSGEFIRQITDRHDHIKASVLDLPVVCEVGREHCRVAKNPANVHFIPGDINSAALPGGVFDLISFKSVLHDWPDVKLVPWLLKVREALPKGGRILIYERVKDYGPALASHGNLPLHIFSPFYRTSNDYRSALLAAGFQNIACDILQLDMPFAVIVAQSL